MDTVTRVHLYATVATQVLSHTEATVVLHDTLTNSFDDYVSATVNQ